MTGVYFLKKGNKIVYVGQSADIGSRIKAHKQDGTKKFNNYTYIECKKELLMQTEEAFILQYSPIYNIKKFFVSSGNKIDGKAKSKTLQVDDKTHKQIKAQALENDMSIKEYIQHLADKDKK